MASVGGHQIAKRMFRTAARLLVLTHLSLNLHGQIRTLPADDKRYALLVGVSDYEDAKIAGFPEKSPDNDVRSMKDALVKHAGFLPENVRVLSSGGEADEKPTLHNIVVALSALQNEVPQDGLFLFFFSGHGISVESKPYLLPSDARYLSTPLMARLSLGVDLLRQSIEEMKVAQVIIMLDACRNDPFGATKGETPNPLTSEFRTQLDLSTLNREISAHATFFATGEGYRAYVDPRTKLGFFAETVIDALAGKSIKPPVTLGALAKYVQDSVPVRVKSQWGDTAIQQPFLRVDGYLADDLILTTSLENAKEPSSAEATIVSHEQIHKLEKTDPELGLMLHTAWAQLMMSTKTVAWQGIYQDLQTRFVSNRWRLTGSLPPSIKPGALVGPAISSDGTLLLACSEPSTVVAINLLKTQFVANIPLTLPSGGRRRVLLDSCTISISQDNRFAIVQVTTDGGGSHLSMVKLNQTGAPVMDVAGYDMGVFAGNSIALVKGNILRLMSIGTWAEYESLDLGAKQTKSLLADPQSALLGVVTNESLDIFPIDQPTGKLNRSGTSARTNCSPAADAYLCESFGPGRLQSIGQNGRGFGSGGLCEGSNCRVFSSSAKSTSAWSFIFQGVSEPNMIRFKDFLLNESTPISLPERVLQARLLANGEVVVLGNRGNIYRFSSFLYEECCRIPISTSARLRSFATGTNGIAVALTGSNDSGVLEIFRGRDFVMNHPVSDIEWVRKVLLSASNQVVVLAGEMKIRVLEFSNASYDTLVSTSTIDCGLPAAIDPSSAKIVCVGSESRIPQLRDLRSGKVDREFDGHDARVQAVSVDERTVTIGGSSSGGNQTLVTNWRRSDGSRVYRSSCESYGSDRAKPLAFLRQGRSFVTLETSGHISARESDSCREQGRLEANFGVNQLSSAISTGRAVIWGGVQPESNDARYFTLFDPLEPNAMDKREPWYMEKPIEALELSPDASYALVQTGNRLLRLPITSTGFMDLLRTRLVRNFSPQECAGYFSGVSCPTLLNNKPQ